MKKLLLVILVITLLASVAGCGAALKDAESLVDSYYAAVNSADYDTVFDLCSPEFFQASTRSEYRLLLNKIGSKLGMAADWERRSYKVSSYAGTGGGYTLVTLEYSVKYSGGETATETFTVIKQDDEMKIRGYNISSLALIID